MDGLHRAGNGTHQGRDRHIYGLSHVKRAFVCVAVILRQPEPGVVRQHGNLVPRADGIAGVQRHGFQQLS